MSLSDPISDMLTRVRNAHSAEKETVDMPHSRVKGEIARILKREGYVRDFTVEGAGGKRTLRVFLKYGPDGEKGIAGLRRVSKPGLRRYKGSEQMPRVLGGMGLAIVSTSSGILTDAEARRQKVGGEVLCYVW
jgi:small subunit ribosomal protein S8